MRAGGDQFRQERTVFQDLLRGINVFEKKIERLELGYPRWI